MNKFPELLWTKLNKIKIQNNRDHPIIYYISIYL